MTIFSRVNCTEAAKSLWCFVILFELSILLVFKYFKRFELYKTLSRLRLKLINLSFKE